MIHQLSPIVKWLLFNLGACPHIFFLADVILGPALSLPPGILYVDPDCQVVNFLLFSDKFFQREWLMKHTEQRSPGSTCASWKYKPGGRDLLHTPAGHI